MKNNERLAAERHIPKGGWLEILDLLNSFFWILVFQLVGLAFLVAFWIKTQQSFSLMNMFALGFFALFNFGVLIRLLLFVIFFPKIFMRKLQGFSRGELETYEREETSSKIRYRYSLHEWFQLVFSLIMAVIVSIIIYILKSNIADKYSSKTNSVRVFFYCLLTVIIFWIVSTIVVKTVLIWRGIRTFKENG